MTYDEKIEQIRQNRSNALNSKVKISQAQINAIEEDNFNKKFLFGDTSNNGILDIIKLYYEEENLEKGITFTKPSLTNMNNLTTWNNQFTSAISIAGDEEFYLDSDTDGLADEELNLTTEWLNGNDAGSETDGIFGDLNYFLEFNIGIDVSDTTTVTSLYEYVDASAAEAAAISFLYPNNYSKIGKGIRGRRTRNVEITTESNSDPLYRYIIGGDATTDEPTFYSNLTDINSQGGGEKTEFLTNLNNLISSINDTSDYQSKLTEIYNAIYDIKNGNNEIFEEASMSTDIDDDTIAITTLKNNLDIYVGTNTDTLIDDTLWGYYNWFNTADGTEGTFDTNLTNLETLINTIKTTITTRFNNIEGIIGDINPASFTKLRKWRYFWINTIIGKPTSSLINLNGMNTAISTANNTLNKANEELSTLFGSTAIDREKYIPTPELVTSFNNHKRDDEGNIIQLRIGFAYIGQAHATKYKIYRRTIDNITYDNEQWNDTVYLEVTDLDNKTGNVKMIYNDIDNNFTIGDIYCYRVRTFDETNDSFISASEESKIYDDTNEYSFTEIVNGKINIGENDLSIGQIILIKNTTSNNGFYFINYKNEEIIGINGINNLNESGNLYLTNSIVIIS